MRAPRLSIVILLFALVAVAIVAGLVWVRYGQRIQQARAVAALQSGGGGSVPLVVFKSGTDKSGQRPAGLPPWADTAIEDLLKRTRGKAHLPGSATEPFRTFFRDPIDDVMLAVSPGADTGAALALLPHLGRCHLFERPGGALSEEEWKRIFAGLRQCPVLMNLTVHGQHVTDAALAPLAGHPNLIFVSLRCDRVTDECGTTFDTLPALQTVIVTGTAAATGELPTSPGYSSGRWRFLTGRGIYWQRLPPPRSGSRPAPALPPAPRPTPPPRDPPASHVPAPSVSLAPFFNLHFPFTNFHSA